jgi:hypothetical protein
MKKAYINLPDSDLHASQYIIKIEYQDGDVFEKEVTNYSYSDLFDLIKDNHEEDYDRSVKSIKIDFVK